MKDYYKPYPVAGVCAFCAKEFAHPIRKQGGGRYKKYCSTNCVKLAWAAGNPEKRQVSITKYDQKPESIEAKKLRNKVVSLKQKYGLTPGQVEAQLARQGYRCYGCFNELTLQSACVDHSHSDGAIRTLLCNHCNWALGHARDNPLTLRRLMATLDYKRDKFNIYLIGSLRNPDIPKLANEIRKHEGFDVMDEWTTPGELADTNWQEYEVNRGRGWADAMRSRGCQNIFLFDRAYMDHADVIVLTLPCGKSAMCELGYAAGINKKTILFLNGNEPDRYEVMPNFAQHIVKTQEELITLLKELQNGK